MAGGEGSRLRPLTSRRPKPLVPVAGRPIMEHILGLLRGHGITEVVVTLQYLGGEIRNHFGDGSDLGMRIEYVTEDLPLGTAGSVRNAAHLLDDTFLVISGDALTDFDLSRVVAHHRERAAQATIVLASVANPLEYGVIVTEADGSVRRFIEKPSWGEVISDQVNTGIYVVEPSVLGLIPQAVSFDWSQDVFPAMLQRGDALIGLVMEGYWQDVGTITAYLQANWDALDGRVRCDIPGRRDQDGVWVGEGVDIGAGVRIEGPAFIGDEARIGAGAFLNGPVVVERYATVDALAKVSNSVIGQHSYIGERARLRQALVCRNVTVKNMTLLEENTVVADDCIVGEGARLMPGVKLWPNKEVQAGSTVYESVIWADDWKQGLFSSHGLTGLVNVELTPEFCSRLGAAFAGTLAKGATVAITRDIARGSRMIKRAMISGIAASGARVRDLSELPVPITQFAARAEDCAAGVHILESPLDRRSADIRFFDGFGLPLAKPAERKVENLFFREDFRRVAVHEIGDIEYRSPQERYIQHVLDGVDLEAVRAAGLRVVVDYDYSAASIVLPDLLSRLGVTAIPLHQGFGEQFESRSKDRWEAGLKEMALITRTLHADLGCAINVSAERLWVADGTGRNLSDAELLGCLCVLALSAARSDERVVMAPATAPHWLAGAVSGAGGSLVSTRVDPAAVVRAAAMSPSALLAGDVRGGVVWPRHLGGFDAMATMVHLLELLAHTGRALAAVRSHLPRGVLLQTTEFCPWEAKGTVMRRLVEELQSAGARLDLVDGIKVQLDDGFVLVLPDADTPNYHVVVSVDDEPRARSLLAEYAQRVREAQRSEGPEPARAAILEKA